MVVWLFFSVFEFELRASCLLVFCSLSHIPISFCFNYFSDRASSFFLGQPCTVILPFSATQVAGLQICTTMMSCFWFFIFVLFIYLFFETGSYEAKAGLELIFLLS
jgi:hypothetical protein